MQEYFGEAFGWIIFSLIGLTLFGLAMLFGRKKEREREREGYYSFRSSVMGKIVIIIILPGAWLALTIAYVFFIPEYSPEITAARSPLLILLPLSLFVYCLYILWRTIDVMGFDSEGNLVLKTLFSNKRIPPGNIHSLTIKSHGYGATACWLVYEGGKSMLPGNFDGMNEFVNRLKEANPKIKIKGL